MIERTDAVKYSRVARDVQANVLFKHGFSYFPHHPCQESQGGNTSKNLKALHKYIYCKPHIIHPLKRDSIITIPYKELYCSKRLGNDNKHVQVKRCIRRSLSKKVHLLSAEFCHSLTSLATSYVLQHHP